MGMEDGELVAFVLQEEVGGIAWTQLEAVGALERVLAGEVALGDAVAKRDQAAGLVRRLLARVLDELAGSRPELPPDRVLHRLVHVLRLPECRGQVFPAAVGEDRDDDAVFELLGEPAGDMEDAPDDTPAKIPSARGAPALLATDSALETRSFRSSCATSRIGGT